MSSSDFILYLYATVSSSTATFTVNLYLDDEVT